jgi:outer membrane protein OmpA-like peptidoglycan-associated protein
MTDKSGYPTDRRVDIVVNNKIKKRPPESKTVYKPKKDTLRKTASSNLDDVKHLKTGSTLLLKNVYFPADRHIIKPESEETLEKLYIVLRDNPNIKISIEGHVCCIRDADDAEDLDTHEQTLSVNRAKAIYDYLVNKGIDPKRLTYAGFGRRRPVVENEQNEEDAEKNRRVEIRVIENK